MRPCFAGGTAGGGDAVRGYARARVRDPWQARRRSTDYIDARRERQKENEQGLIGRMGPMRPMKRTQMRPRFAGGTAGGGDAVRGYARARVREPWQARRRSTDYITARRERQKENEQGLIGQTERMRQMRSICRISRISRIVRRCALQNGCVCPLISGGWRRSPGRTVCRRSRGTRSPCSRRRSGT